MVALGKTDLVYTWVDGAWPGYQDTLREWSSSAGDLNPERYRDQFSMLKYSLRSAAKNLPWVDRIHVVTMRPQVPDWLNVDHPRINIIHHDQIIPELYLPTFNSYAIESFLHSIPGLAPHFIYSNDDFLFYSPVARDVFFRDGKYVVFKTVFGETPAKWFCRDKTNPTGLFLGDHMPVFINRDDWRAMTERHSATVNASRQRRFRNRDEVELQRLYRSWLLRRYRFRTHTIRYRELTKIAYFHRIYNDQEGTHRGFEEILARQPLFVCLNDDQKGEPDPAVEDVVKTFLAETYPNPSEFER